ncbi:MAG: PadR family transcriptional regulator [Gemmatimonadales bacterium]
MASADFSLLRGTLDLLVLRAVAAGPSHGFGITQWIRQVTRDELRIEDGAMYSSLHRLERRGFLKSDWGVTENNRRARYYTLTGAGRRELARDTAEWTAYAVAVFRVLKSQREAIALLEEAS